MTFGSLFSGIGGIDLGLQRAGFEIAWQCEIDPYCRRVLAKHWPDVPRIEDVHDVSGKTVRRVDLIAGGSPCQDISLAGRGAGLAGERSGLWYEFARVVGDLRPRYVLVENVAALLGRGLGDVLGDLAALGYDAEWHCIPASHIGAPHSRDRIWIVAHARSERLEGEQSCGPEAQSTRRGSGEPAGMDPMPMLRRLPMHDPHDACVRVRVPFGGRVAERPICGSGAWSSGPTVFRMAHGIRNRVDRLRGLGNSVVPQLVELIGRAILAAAGEA